ncbi:transmembrane protein 183A isoform X2 [Phyllostomus discolor]|uniref:Transmembrane protein 183A isoform X2 n=1 Tax=Phyllostomus discolor TaxID=89673 RepID=A0A7E6CY90_9CHIR|nr:transmembrane protein 183A isoform X2 [Phyllostomus discolor]
MARGPGPLGRPRPDTAAMPKRGKRLKFRAHDACSGRVTVADYANSDPAVVRSGRVKKAVANAIQQEVKSLCGLEASQVPAVEALSGAGEPCDITDSSDEMDTPEESVQERTVSRKKKSKRHRDLDGAGEEYPMDIWLLLASYIRPEDIVNFSLICKNAWTVTCTAAFWTRLYRRCGHRELTVVCVADLMLFVVWTCSQDGDLCTFSTPCQALHAGRLPASAPAPRVHGEAALPPGVRDPVSVPHVRALRCPSLQKPSHSGEHAQHLEEFQMLTFLVQEDCWEQTGANVGIQLQVQKAAPQIEEQVRWGAAASRSVRRRSHQPRPGLLPPAGHHPQFHLHSHRHGHDIHSVYGQCEHGHAASPSATGVPRLSGPRRPEAAQ